MATENKTDRKKQIKTSVLGSTLVFLSVEPEGEIARLDTGDLTYDMTCALRIYGAKQVCSDVVAGATTMAEKSAGIQRAVASLQAGNWPTRQPVVSIDAAAAKLAAAMGMSVEDMMAKLKG